MFTSPMEADFMAPIPTDGDTAMATEATQDLDLGGTAMVLKVERLWWWHNGHPFGLLLPSTAMPQEADC